MDRDNTIRTLYDVLQEGIPWNDFNPDIAFKKNLWGASFYLWYYAEEQVYIIRDVMINSYWFIEASNPYDALEIVLKGIEEAEQAGEAICDEEVMQ